MKDSNRSRAWTVEAAKGAVAIAALAVMAVVLVTCTRSDPIAPADSTITVSANPQTVLVLNNIAGDSLITATVRTKTGTRIEGQEVTFSTTQGTLAPPAQTAVLTDSRGQASSKLSTTVQATVTAQSGSISGTTTVGIVNGNISSLELNPDTTQNVATCNDTIGLTALASDSNGDGVAGISLQFKTTLVSGFGELRGTFTPLQGRTDSNGELHTDYGIDTAWCSQHCQTNGDPNSSPWVCKIDIYVQDSSGAFKSASVRIDESVP